MIGLAFECVNLSGSCYGRFSQLLPLCADRQEAAQQQQKSGLFAYRPVITCTGTCELPC